MKCIQKMEQVVLDSLQGVIDSLQVLSKRTHLGRTIYRNIDHLEYRGSNVRDPY
jgi:hypothetical protein